MYYKEKYSFIRVLICFILVSLVYYQAVAICKIVYVLQGRMIGKYVSKGVYELRFARKTYLRIIKNRAY